MTTLRSTGWQFAHVQFVTSTSPQLRLLYHCAKFTLQFSTLRCSDFVFMNIKVIVHTTWPTLLSPKQSGHAYRVPQQGKSCKKAPASSNVLHLHPSCLCLLHGGRESMGPGSRLKGPFVCWSNRKTSSNVGGLISLTQCHRAAGVARRLHLISACATWELMTLPRGSKDKARLCTTPLKDPRAKRRVRRTTL